MYKNVYTMRDFNLALDGLKRFDTLNNYRIFDNDEFVEELNLIAETVPEEPETEVVEETEKKVESNQKKRTIHSHPLIEYEGLYSHPGYGTMEIVLQKDSLFAFTPNNKVWLRHYHLMHAKKML